MPGRGDLGEHQPAYADGLEHGEELCHHQQPLPVPAIHQGTGQRREQYGGELPSTDHDP